MTTPANTTPATANSALTASIGRTQRISSGFYTSQALELVRHG